MLTVAWELRMDITGKKLRAASGLSVNRPPVYLGSHSHVISIQEIIMGRALLSVLLATILWFHCGLSGKAQVAAADSSSEVGSAQRLTLKEKVTRIPAGSQVEVRLLNRERIRGRLVDVSPEAFTVQVAKGNRIDTRHLAFSDAKSVKQLGGGKGKYILIAAGIALVVIVLLAVVVTHSVFKGLRVGGI